MFLNNRLSKVLPLSDLITLWYAADNQARVQASFKTTIIGIDGPAGAGKSSFCAALAEIDPAITIVHMDDFFLPSILRKALNDEIGPQIDWRRMIEQVVTPMVNGLPGRYQRFDWTTQALKEWCDVPTGGIVLLDGVYSTREEISPFLVQRIWITVPRDLGLQRGIDRDGEESRDWWMTDWVEEEDRYVLMCQPENLADIVIDGVQGLKHYERGEYAQLR